MFEVSIEGLGSLTSRFHNAPAKINNATKHMMNVATMMVWGKAKELAPVDKGTLRTTMLRTYNADEGRVGSNLPYAKYQEFGTGIYGKSGVPIVPKRARMLAWTTKGGQLAFAKSVRGVPAKHFLQGGIDELKRNINQVLDIAAKLIVTSI